MAVTTPPSVTALPTPPSTASPSNFDTRADAFLGALPTFQTETDALAANVYANAADAAASATAAQSSEEAAQTSEANAAASMVAAASSAGASLWVSGTGYALGDVRWSPANGRVYRRIVAGAGTTDPSLDGTNWKVVDNGFVVHIVSGTTHTAVGATHYALTNASATTLTLPATPSAGDTVVVSVANARIDNTIARNGSTIMGLAENMTVDSIHATVTLRFINSTWRLV
jgi:hypothetical protein